MGVNRITFPTGDEELWCGFGQLDSDNDLASAVLGASTYQDACDACQDLGASFEDCDACKQSAAGYGWLLLNIIAGLCCICAAIGVMMNKGKKFAKFAYMIAAIALLVAIVWFCFGSPLCYDYEDGEPQLGYSMYFDIIAMIFLIGACWCVK